MGDFVEVDIFDGRPAPQIAPPIVGDAPAWVEEHGRRYYLDSDSSYTRRDVAEREAERIRGAGVSVIIRNCPRDGMDDFVLYIHRGN